MGAHRVARARPPADVRLAAAAAGRRRRADGLIALVTWGLGHAARDGGGARLLATARFARQAPGGGIVDLAPVEGRGGPASTLLRALGRLASALLRGRSPYLLFEYPGFPAIEVYYRSARPGAVERLARSLVYLAAIATVHAARASCAVRRRRLVVSVSDVPSQELDLPDRNRRASRRLTHAYERALLHAADAIWVVTPQERDLLVRVHGVPADRFVIVPNGNPPMPPLPPWQERAPVRIAYPGSLYRDRQELTTLVRGILASAPFPLEVVFAGPGGEWVAEDLPDARVRWLGTLTEEECYELVAGADLGLLVYFDDEPYYEIVHPTKLSLYLAGGAPIVSGNAAYIASFIEEHGVGVAVAREAFVEAAVALAGDPGRRRAMRERAVAVRERFFWDAILERAAADTRTVAPPRR